MENKKLPLKAFVIAVLIAAARLLSPSSAEARPIPPGLTGQDIACIQNTINEMKKSNRDTDPMQWARRVQDNKLRGEGVLVVSRLDIHFDRSGNIIGKDTRTVAEVDDIVSRSRLSSTNFVRDPLIQRSRKIDVWSERGEVGIDDHGDIVHHL